jgi:hypothetical protein
MRTIAFMSCWIFFHSPTPAHTPARGGAEVERVVDEKQFERAVEELRAVHGHTDDYLILRLEIDAMRRHSPEHSEFLDRYLQRMLPEE